jgi:hypothetical protein
MATTTAAQEEEKKSGGGSDSDMSDTTSVGSGVLVRLVFKYGLELEGGPVEASLLKVSTLIEGIAEEEGESGECLCVCVYVCMYV